MRPVALTAQPCVRPAAVAFGRTFRLPEPGEDIFRPIDAVQAALSGLNPGSNDGLGPFLAHKAMVLRLAAFGDVMEALHPTEKFHRDPTRPHILVSRDKRLVYDLATLVPFRPGLADIFTPSNAYGWLLEAPVQDRLKANVMRQHLARFEKLEFTEDTANGTPANRGNPFLVLREPSGGHALMLSWLRFVDVFNDLQAAPGGATLPDIQAIVKTPFFTQS